MAAVLCFCLALGPAFARGGSRRRAAARPTGVIVYSLTTNARIEIDGRTVGTVPFEGIVHLAPGSHTVRVIKRGYAERTEVVNLKQGQVMELELDLLPFAGVAEVKCNADGASLLLDGKSFSKLPFDGEIPMGKHKLQATARGYMPAEQEVDIEGGKSYKIFLELKPAAEVMPEGGSAPGLLGKWWFWTAAGAVLIGSVAAVVVMTSAGQPEPLPTPDATRPF